MNRPTRCIPAAWTADLLRALRTNLRIAALLGLVCIGTSLVTPTTAEQPPVTSVTEVINKTLVAWVSPGNLTQQGGSVLTLDDQQSHFDGVVFGELARAKWMAGSDFYSRTKKEQTTDLAETADPKTLVQVAIVYRGNQITVYRNGKEYSRHQIAHPQTFGLGSAIVMGLRHLEASGHPCFVGTIEDARIYNVPLSAEQIAALAPNQPSDPKPLAWWSFANGKVTDRMNTFPVTTLVGNARIADSKLQLDNGAYLVAAKAAPEKGPAVIKSGDLNASMRALREKLLSDPYRAGYHFVIPEGCAMPFDPNGAIYWKGRYHLFYIFQDHRGHNWGHVSSIDLFHWRHHPTGLVAGMFSGNCFINKEGRPTMCYHQVGQGNAMAVAVDDELNEWKKLDSNPITPKNVF
jgi:beta-fructofuranosidase